MAQKDIEQIYLIFYTLEIEFSNEIVNKFIQCKKVFTNTLLKPSFSNQNIHQVKFVNILPKESFIFTSPFEFEDKIIDFN